MDVDVEGVSIRLRARAARERAAELCEAARALGRAAEFRADRESRREWVRRRASRRLEWETAAIDDGVLASPTMSRFRDADARVVGRDPVIEEAKTLLCERYGIGRREAFELLRHLSSRTNRKLRDVGRSLVYKASGSGE